MQGGGPGLHPFPLSRGGGIGKEICLGPNKMALNGNGSAHCNWGYEGGRVGYNY